MSTVLAVDVLNIRTSRDNILRAASFSRTLNEANHRETHEDEFLFDSLMAAAAKQLGHQVPEQDKLFRLGRTEGESLQEIYEPKSLYTVFVPDDWKHTYKDGAYFKFYHALSNNKFKGDV